MQSCTRICDGPTTPDCRDFYITSSNEVECNNQCCPGKFVIKCVVQ